jgi:hypothetical protein
MAYKWWKQSAGCVIHRSEEKYRKVKKQKKSKKKWVKVIKNE